MQLPWWAAACSRGFGADAVRQEGGRDGGRKSSDELVANGQLTLPSLLLLTKDTRMRLLSLPWYLSTVLTSTLPTEDRARKSLMVRSCCLYGAMMPMLEGPQPACVGNNCDLNQPPRLRSPLSFTESTARYLHFFAPTFKTF